MDDLDLIIDAIDPTAVPVMLSFRAQTDTEILDRWMIEAKADPHKWANEHRDDINRAKNRRSVRRFLRRHPDLKDFDDETFEVGELYMDCVASGQPMPMGMSEERKAKLHKWINRALPVLKIIATFTPPPYNLAIIAFIIILVIVDQRYLTPQELASILGEPPASAECVPAIAV